VREERVVPILACEGKSDLKWFSDGMGEYGFPAKIWTPTTFSAEVHVLFVSLEVFCVP
jgi:hypothetical protein